MLARRCEGCVGERPSDGDVPKVILRATAAAHLYSVDVNKVYLVTSGYDSSASVTDSTECYRLESLVSKKHLSEWSRYPYRSCLFEKHDALH